MSLDRRSVLRGATVGATGVGFAAVGAVPSLAEATPHAVAAKKRDNLALGDVERHTLQHAAAGWIAGNEIFDLQHQ